MNAISTPRAELVLTRLKTRGVSNQRLPKFPERPAAGSGPWSLISASEHPAAKRAQSPYSVPHVANTRLQCFFCFGSSLLVRHL
jgi:hypothetical protein